MNLLNKYALFLLFFTGALYSCKKDLGNYNYTTPNLPVQDTAGIAATYSVEQYSNLKINPTIHYSGDTSNLNYQWVTYAKSLSSPVLGAPTVISNQRNLNVSLNISPGTYYLELDITDKTNSYKTASRSVLNVLASIETGWLVLHTLNNQSDVDFIASTNLSPTGPNKRASNLFQAVIGNKIAGDGQVIGFSRRSNSIFNWITIGTDQNIERVNGFSFSLIGANKDLFRRPLTSNSFQAHINNGSNELLIGNGLLYVLPWGLSVQDALFNAPYNGDYTLAPYFVYNDFSPFGALVYDQKYGKFLYTGQTFNNNFIQFKPAAVTTPAQAFDPSNVGKTLLFMDRGYNKYAYAFFKDQTGNSRYLYVLNQTLSDAGKLAVATYDMSALPEITNAQFYQVGDLGNVALYATSNTVYRFDYSGTKAATVNFSVPANEKITAMKIFKPQSNMNAPVAEFTLTNNSVIYIATWDGTQGKLYELSINVASGIINPVPLKTYTGFGKIKDMVAKFRGSGS